MNKLYNTKDVIKVQKDINIGYFIKEGKLKGKFITEKILYSIYPIHEIVFYGCNMRNSEIQKYINELDYKMFSFGKTEYNYYHVALYKNLNKMTKEELNNIEMRILIIELTN